MTELTLDTRLDAQQRDYLGIVKSSSEALLRVINDILDFSKIEAGKLSVENIVFNVSALLSQTLRSLALPASDKALKLTGDIDPSMPIQLLGDPGRLQQIVLNLLGNAIKFTEKGEVTLRVRRIESSSLTACRMEIVVEDTGIGIAPDKLSMIFEAFNQEDASTTRRFGGTGLGLSISSRLVELMGGQIRAESELGRGSRFIVELELSVVNEPQPEASSTLLAASSPLPEQPTMLNILLVEDHVVNQKLATALLHKLGHQVTLAGNGQEALAMLGPQQFDLVFMDMQMPVMGGVEATRLFRDLEKKEGRLRTPVIAMTANAMQSDRDYCLSAGMDDHLAKPIDARQLKSYLAKFSGSAKASSGVDTIAAGPSALSMATGSDGFDYAAAIDRADPEIVEIIAALVIETVPDQLSQLRDLLGAGKAAEALCLAHALKGTMAAFNAEPAQGLLGEIEQRCQAGSVAGCLELAVILDREVLALCSCLKRIGH